jgi:hypothetical protein
MGMQAATGHNILASIKQPTLAALCALAALGVTVSEARADAIVSGIQTFGGGNENITSTLAVLDAVNHNIIYLGSYLASSPGAVSTPLGASISGTGTGSSGTITSNVDTIYYYDVKAGSTSDLIRVTNPAGTVNWTTDWANLLVGGGNVAAVSHIDVFGVAGSTPRVPEPTSLALFGVGMLGTGLVARRRRQSRLRVTAG